MKAGLDVQCDRILMSFIVLLEPETGDCVTGGFFFTLAVISEKGNTTSCRPTGFCVETSYYEDRVATPRHRGKLRLSPLGI